jgi:hypothetical protein
MRAAAGPLRSLNNDCRVWKTGECAADAAPATAVARVVAVVAGLMGAEAAVVGGSGVTGRRTGTESVRGGGGGGGIGRLV